jgi:hypothetical protein
VLVSDSGETPWDLEPVAPFRMAWGILDENDRAQQVGFMPQETLQGAIAAFSFKFPPMTNEWASVVDAKNQCVVAFVHHTDTNETAWRGCKAAFDELDRWMADEDVAWAAAVSQSHHLLRLQSEEGL